MLTQKYRNLIDVLVQKTTAGVIHWEKGRGRFSYQAKAGDNTFKVDKYFAGNHRLNTLYSRVEQQANNGMIQQEVPVVTSITQSLQQVI